MKPYLSNIEKLAIENTDFRRVLYTAPHSQLVLQSLLQGEEIGAEHNIVNTGSKPMKLYTLYAPANHIDGRIHKTKNDAIVDAEDEAFGEQA